MRPIYEFTWIEERGRNGDGDPLNRYTLVDHNGRCVARVYTPQADEKDYRCVILVGNLPEDDAFHYFIDMRPAQRYCEDRAREVIKKEMRRSRSRSRVAARIKVLR
jgi:hypothetical protein